MTATEELRRLLDEREADYRVSATGYSIDIGPYTTAYANRSDTTLDVSLRQVTPEHAIAATLGATDANPTQEESSGTCHDVWDTELTGRLRFQCSECRGVSLEITPRFCPCCGRKVVDPTTNDVDAEVNDG